MSITLTPSALSRVQQFTQLDAKAIGLRFGVKKMGCSGWAYVVEVAHERKDSELLFELSGVQVLVERDQLAIVDGTEIDFVRRGINTEFAFRNPNAVGECGCGESFSVEKAAI